MRPRGGSVFPLGDTTVSCDATDAAGNAAAGSFVIEVRDRDAPVFKWPPNPLVVTSSSASGTYVRWSITARDNVDESGTPSCDHRNGGLYAPGDTTVNCWAVDRAGNRASGTFVVRVTYVPPAPPR